jgi:outer membrane receptor protein involved in Fe transport
MADRRGYQWILFETACGVLAFLPALVLSGPVLAQEDQDGAGEPEEEIEQIIVTATLRETALQDVPLSVTALTGAELERINADSFSGYLERVPGVTVVDAGPGFQKIAIRGIADGGRLYTNTLTGIYLDNTPLDFAGVDPDLKLVDVARVEVLRGPQGTLYGSGSMGGTIRTVTNRPNYDEFEASVGSRYGDTRHGDTSFHIDGTVNLPVMEDRLAIRASAYRRDNGGYINDTVNDVADFNSEDTVGGRLAVGIKATDRLSFTLMGLHQDMDLDGFPDDDPDSPPLENAVTFTPENSGQEVDLYNALVDWDAGPVTLVSSTSGYEQDQLSTFDVSFAVRALLGLPEVAASTIVNTIDVERLVHETRVLSNDDGRWSWLAGVFYSDFENTIREQTALEGTGLLINSSLYSRLEQTAGFGEISWQLSDSLEGTVGLRVYKYDLESINTFHGAILQPPGMSQTFASEDGVSPKFNLAYAPNDGLMMYMQVAKGYRPGVGNEDWSAQCPDEDIVLQADSDTIWNYELGSKLTFANGRGFLNGSVYYIDWDDIQINLQLESCGFGQVVNAGAAESKGFDLEVTFFPTDNLEVSGNVAYTKAEVTEGAEALGGTNGEQIPMVPERTGNLLVRQAFPLSNDSKTAFVQANYHYVDKQRNMFSSNPAAGAVVLDDYYLINCRIGLSSDRWSAELYVDNVTDERIELDASTFLGVTEMTRNRPRTIGVSVRAYF